MSGTGPSGGIGLTLAPTQKQDLQNLVNSQIQEMQDYQRSLCASGVNISNTNSRRGTSPYTTTTNMTGAQQIPLHNIVTMTPSNTGMTGMSHHPPLSSVDPLVPLPLTSTATMPGEEGHQYILQSIAAIECTSMPEDMSELTTLPGQSSLLLLFFSILTCYTFPCYYFYYYNI